MKRRAGVAGILGAIVLCCVGATDAAALAPRDCSMYASPGAAGGDGTPDRPFGSAQELINALGPGQTGCLRPGTYTENMQIERSAPADQPITLTSADPVQRAVVTGSPSSERPATIRFNNAAGIRLEGFIVRGVRAPTASPAVVVHGANNALVGMEITNEGNTTCVSVGINASSPSANALLEGNFLHTCGTAINGNNGISVGHATGTVITDNTIIGVPARGIQLYPEAQGSVIRNNVIDNPRDGMGDGMGVQFAGEGAPSSNNVVERNIISNAESFAIGFYWGGPPGTGNVARDNCIFSPSGASGEYQRTSGQPVGYSIEGGVSADPLYVDRGSPPTGFALRQGSPCGESGGSSARGPLPSPVAGQPEVLVSPESDSVISAQLKGEINSHLQAGTATFGLTGGPSSLPGDVQVFPSFVGAEYTTQVQNLEPDTDYSFQVTARNNGGSRTSAPRTFRTPPAPTIAPVVPQVTYQPKVRKDRIELTNLRVRGGGGEIVEVALTCAGRTTRCSDRLIQLGAQPLNLRLNPVLRNGGSLVIAAGIRQAGQVQSPSYNGRATTLSARRVRRAGMRLNRQDSCIEAPPATVSQPQTPFGPDGAPSPPPPPGSTLAGSLGQCLRVTFAGAVRNNASQFSSLAARAVPAGASVRVTCRGRGCPKLPPCRTFPTRRNVSLLLSGRTRRRFPRTARLSVQITKPRTRGLASNFTFTRNGPRQSYSSLAPSVQASNCPTDV